MAKQLQRENLYGEWRLIHTGRKQERLIPVDSLEIHPDYPFELDAFTEDDIQKALHYLQSEGAPSHRLYVMPDPARAGKYYVIGWFVIYEAYRRCGFKCEIPTLCYLTPGVHTLLWQNWQQCPGNYYDIK
ncbi:MAG: hypothetical protein ACE5GL_10630 [Calditrichia bacterium]